MLLSQSPDELLPITASDWQITARFPVETFVDNTPDEGLHPNSGCRRNQLARVGLYFPDSPSAAVSSMSIGENPSVVVNPVGTIPEMPSRASSCPADAAVAAGKWLGETQSEIRQLFTFAYRNSRASADRLARTIRNRAQYLRDERPLPLLGTITACAFALGVGVAIWRSRKP